MMSFLQMRRFYRPKILFHLMVKSSFPSTHTISRIFWMRWKLLPFLKSISITHVDRAAAANRGQFEKKRSKWKLCAFIKYHSSPIFNYSFVYHGSECFMKPGKNWNMLIQNYISFCYMILFEMLFVIQLFIVIYYFICN